MQRAKVVINNPLGMHARVAYGFSRLGESFKSKVSIAVENGDRKMTGDGKDIMSILSLGILPGSKLIIETEGEDEENALKTLLEFMDTDNVEKN